MLKKRFTRSNRRVVGIALGFSLILSHAGCSSDDRTGEKRKHLFCRGTASEIDLVAGKLSDPAAKPEQFAALGQLTRQAKFCLPVDKAEWVVETMDAAHMQSDETAMKSVADAIRKVYPE